MSHEGKEAGKSGEIQKGSYVKIKNTGKMLMTV